MITVSWGGQIVDKFYFCNKQESSVRRKFNLPNCLFNREDDDYLEDFNFYFLDQKLVYIVISKTFIIDDRSIFCFFFKCWLFFELQNKKIYKKFNYSTFSIVTPFDLSNLILKEWSNFFFYCYSYSRTFKIKNLFFIVHGCENFGKHTIKVLYR